jgi:hypothetical protein
VTTLTNPTPEVSDSFGIAVAGVGPDKVLVGAHADHFGANNGGAAYLFSTNGALLTTITNPTPATGDQFGVSVAAVGGEAMLIGAAHDSGGGTDAGAVYLFGTGGELLGIGSGTALELASIGGGGNKNFVINTTGFIGLGTTDPQAVLHVSGNNSQLRLHDTGRNNFWSLYTENHPTPAISGNLLFIPGPGGVFGFIQKTTGNYFSGSDLRLKTEVCTLTGVLDRVLELRPVSYRFKSGTEPSPRTLGLIAQEVEPLFPEVVSERDGMKSMAYSELVPVTVGAIQELNRKYEKEFQRKETEIAELKRSVEELKTLVNALARKSEAGAR